MANNYLAVINTVDGHSKFKKGVKWYYPLDDAVTYQTAAEAFNAFKADEVREAKVVPSLPAAPTGKIWRVKVAIYTDNATLWYERAGAANGQDGAIYAYLDEAAGQTLFSVIVHDNGQNYQAVYNYDQNGYPNNKLINPNRTGGLPRYAALHQSVPNGGALYQVRNAAGVIMRSERDTITANGPTRAFIASAPPTNPGGGTGGGGTGTGATSPEYYGGVLGDPPAGRDSDNVLYPTDQFATLGV